MDEHRPLEDQLPGGQQQASESGPLPSDGEQGCCPHHLADDLVAEAEPEPGELQPLPLQLPVAAPATDGPQLEVGVAFAHNTKMYSFASGGLRLNIGDQVLVQTDKGVDLGEVVRIKGRISPDRARELSAVLRVATPEDLAHVAQQRDRERKALSRCEEKIAEHNLPMKLIDAHLSFDNTRLVFLFTAEGRVDFRELVRDLARTFKMRIELRQVGVRDEAKLLGGLGPCGRPLCCKMFMRNFEPVGIRIAKDQGLALNPAKLSGLCDRLMCCLRFEHETYLAHKALLPPKGTRVHTPAGAADVVELHLLAERVTVRLDDGREMTFVREAVRPLAEGVQVGVPSPEGEESVGDGDVVLPLPAEREDIPVATPAAQPVPVDAGLDVASESPQPGSPTTGRKRKRRSRRKRAGAPAGPTEQASGPAHAGGADADDPSPDQSSGRPPADDEPRRRPRHRRGGRRRRRRPHSAGQEVSS